MTPEQAKAICDQTLIKAMDRAGTDAVSVIFQMTLFALRNKEFMDALTMRADVKPVPLNRVRLVKS